MPNAGPCEERYIECQNHVQKFVRCAEQLIFDADTSDCVYRNDKPGCEGQAEAPVHPVDSCES